MIDLQKKRDELQEVLKQTAIQLEQLRGAIALCDQLIEEAMKPDDVETVNSAERQLPS